MSEAKKGLDLNKVLRDVRDAGMDAWAKVMLRLTYSHKYQRLQGFIAKPSLLATALFRKTADRKPPPVWSAGFPPWSEI